MTMDPVDAPPVDVTQRTVPAAPPNGTEPCPHCGTPLALDQRYCLECGAPRTYLSGDLFQRLRTPSTQASAVVPPPLEPAWQRANLLTLIAGIGVLLLAMGVGVLIGRSGASSANPSTPLAPQVISVGGSSGAAGAASTPTSTPEETASSTKNGSSRSAGKQSKVKLAPGVGSVPSKPAPPSVLKSLRRKGSGGSFEQKSKNLPDVVETG